MTDALAVAAELERAGIALEWCDTLGRPVPDLDAVIALPDDSPAWPAVKVAMHRPLDLMPLLASCIRCAVNGRGRVPADVLIPLGVRDGVAVCAAHAADLLARFDMASPGWLDRAIPVPGDASALAHPAGGAS